MTKRNRRLTIERILHDVGRDERVTVAIATNPRTHANNRWQRKVSKLGPAFGDLFSSIGLQRTDSFEQREVVVAERFIDFVANPQAAQTQQRGLPQHQHLELEKVFNFRGPRPGARQQFRDNSLRVKNRFSTHLGRVRS
jgi:hypothetical protein